MKVTNQMIKEVVSQTSGEDTLPIVMAIKNKVNVSEFKIAEELHEEIREIRKKLYKLLEYNLVTFRRKKDKKKGWYIYYWTFNPNQVKFLYKNLRVKRLEMLRSRLKRELENSFYICPNACVRLTFQKAFEFDFKCPECGSLMIEQDNSSTIRHLQEEIKKLEYELKEIEEQEKKKTKKVGKKKKVKTEKKKIKTATKKKSKKKKRKKKGK